uniref:hypothetical protein n=1 Tax=Gelidibacter sp. TaxID=2018083 RepID=UPI0040496825
MVSKIKKGATKKSILSLLEKLHTTTKSKGVDTHKFCGTIRLNKDGLAIQKSLRNEWQ